MRQSVSLLRDLSGRAHVSLAGRGAAGIYAALRALGLRGQGVLLPANTCYMVLWAVLRSGNQPLLVDVERTTGNWSVKKLSAVSDQPFVEVDRQKPLSEIKAMIPCHMYGLGAPMAEICAWARARNMYVIEDAALALGATADGRPAGAWGDVSIFSFGLGKIADNQVGGAVLTDDAQLAGEMARILDKMPVWDEGLLRLTNQWNAIYWALHQYEAQNPRLLEVYPTLYDVYNGLTTYRLSPSEWGDLPKLLRNLPDDLEHRERMARLYDDLLRGLPTQSLLRPPGSVLWRYPLLTAPEYRDELLGWLWENGLHDVTRWYPPLRYMAAALAPDVQQPETPGADALGESIINLRVDSGVGEAEVRQTAQLIRAYFQRHSP